MTARASIRGVGRLLSGDESIEAMRWLARARIEAEKSPCRRARCGAVITSGQVILGVGFNSPPGEGPPRCHRKGEIAAGFKSDKTCCVHAEHRAIVDAFTSSWGSRLDGRNRLRVNNARMYFARLDKVDPSIIAPSGDPYCTFCSKFALDAGVAEWCLLHQEGVRVYGAEAYNDISFAYGQEA